MSIEHDVSVPCKRKEQITNIFCRREQKKWILLDEKQSYLQCKVAPPSSSALITSPVAAWTRGGPPRNIVPILCIITASSAIVGTYAPPAVQLPHTTATWNKNRITSFWQLLCEGHHEGQGHTLELETLITLIIGYKYEWNILSDVRPIINFCRQKWRKHHEYTATFFLRKQTSKKSLLFSMPSNLVLFSCSSIKSTFSATVLV